MGFVEGRSASAWAAYWLVTCLGSFSIEAAENVEPNASPAVVADPFFLLIQDDLVRKALSLSESQQTAIDEILREHNQALLAIRDIGPQSAPASVATKIKSARDNALARLDAQQQSRLGQLILQAQGYDALLDTEFQKVLELKPMQREQLRQVGEKFRRQIRESTQEQPAANSTNPQQSVEAAKKDRHQRVLAVLTPRQQTLWAERIGPPIDFSKVRSSPAWAPEFDEVEVWLNSQPLTVEALRGRVVVVHFFAFGCGNCINNYAWYREWYGELPSDKVTIVGIHTPETKTESDVKLLEAKLHENDLKFPVAVDNKKRNWQNWSNGVWPSVYLVDKQGRLRYWWYGELDWQGAGGQRIMKDRIRQLLAEE